MPRKHRGLRKDGLSLQSVFFPIVEILDADKQLIKTTHYEDISWVSPGFVDMASVQVKVDLSEVPGAAYLIVHTAEDLVRDGHRLLALNVDAAGRSVMAGPVVIEIPGGDNVVRFFRHALRTQRSSQDLYGESGTRRLAICQHRGVQHSSQRNTASHAAP